MTLDVSTQRDRPLNIAFFVQPGLDSFLKPIVAELSKDHRTKVMITRNVAELEDGMRWADICWFEWCDALMVHASKLPIALHKKIVCRLHSYEAFTSYIYQVNWSAVDRVIFVGQHIRNYVLGQVPQLRDHQCHVIPNGIQMDRYTFRQRSPGFKIAYVGYINHKKGPMLLLHAFKAIHDRDPRYQLHIAGTFQDLRYQLYFKHMIAEWGIEESVHFDGWQQDVGPYLDDKDYIISASPLESQQLSVMEAMAKGIKPLIHNFYGAKQVYRDDFIWSSIDDLVAQVTSGLYDSALYREFVQAHYAFDQQILKIRALIDTLRDDVGQAARCSETPKVTVGIINYNYAHYLDVCVKSVLAQTYPNLEILIVDDCSTDDSQSKIRAYAEAHSNVRAILHPQNTGTEATAIREFLEHAEGKYLLWISADDFLPHKKVIETYMSCMLSDTTIDYVYGNLTLVNSVGHVTGTWTYRPYTSAEIVRKIYERKGSGIIPMVGMYKLSFYRDHGYDWVVDEQNTNAGDTLNCLVNTKRGWKCQHLNQATLAYRRHGSNLSFNICKRILSLISVMEYIVPNFDESVYLPDYTWEGLSEADKTAQKFYAVGATYLQMSQDYAATSRVAGMDRQERYRCLKPLHDMARRYFDDSLAISQTFASQIDKAYGRTTYPEA
jgi:glycosyltransferase involved in cell wall biosynthesis